MTAAETRLHDEINSLDEELRGVIDMACETEEEQAARTEEIERLTKEIESRNRQLDVEKRAADARAKVAAAKARVNESGLVVSAPKTKKEAPVLKPIAMPNEFRGFEDYGVAEAAGRMLAALGRGEIREIRAVAPSAHPIGVNDSLEPDSMGETSPTYDGKGSELVAHEMYRGIMNIVNYESVAMRLATFLRVSTDGMYVPFGEDIQDADWYEENCEILPIKPNTKRATLSLKKMGARVQVSNELMADAYVSVAGIVSRTIGNAFAHKLDKTLIQGDAKIGFGGIAAAIAAGNTVTTAAAGKVTIGEIADVMGKVDPMAMNRTWLVTDEGWTKVMGLAAGAIGVNVTQGVTQTIFGSPVIRVPTALMPAKTYAIYGDFAKACLVGYKSGLTIRSSWERALEFDQTVYVGTARYAFAVADAKYLVALKSA